MICTHRGPFRLGRLLCDRTTDHDENADIGHTYTTGSHLNDLHKKDGGHG